MPTTTTAPNAADDRTPILDDDGHGTGSTSVSTGNRYGYCPTCLLFFVEGLDESSRRATRSSTSRPIRSATSAGRPRPRPRPERATRAAAERGQTVLFAAGNGIGNAFDVPIATYGSDQTGAAWNITVGAIRRDNQRAIVGDGIPVAHQRLGRRQPAVGLPDRHGRPVRLRRHERGDALHGRIFGTVLTEVRRAIGDGVAGQRPGQVVAEGTPIPGSIYLADGKLTRPSSGRRCSRRPSRSTRNRASTFPFPMTAPYLDARDEHAVRGLRGGNARRREASRRRHPRPAPFLPDRSSRTSSTPSTRRSRTPSTAATTVTATATADDAATGASNAALRDLNLDARKLATLEGGLAALGAVAEAKAAATALDSPTGANPITYYLHRTVAAAEPGATPACDADKNEQSMDRTDSPGDLEPCFENWVTTVVAAYRPVGIFASTDTLDAPLPADSQVTADVYLAGETPAVVRPTGVLMATDREIGEAPGVFMPVLGSGPSGAGCAALGETCWTHFSISFGTTRPAFGGEQVTFQIALFGTRSWAFGHEGAHASRVTIVPAALPEAGFDFGATITEPANGSQVEQGDLVAGGRYDFPALGADEAGGHPTQKVVEISIDDASFANPIKATLDSGTNTWSAPLGNLSRGQHTVYATGSDRPRRTPLSRRARSPSCPTRRCSGRSSAATVPRARTRGRTRPASKPGASTSTPRTTRAAGTPSSSASSRAERRPPPTGRSHGSAERRKAEDGGRREPASVNVPQASGR